LSEIDLLGVPKNKSLFYLRTRKKCNRFKFEM